MGPCPKLSCKATATILNLLKSGNNPEFCTICEKECLTQCLMAGKTIQEVLIESYVPTVYAAVKRLCVGVSYKEDFISAGILGIVKAVNKINETIEDPHAYIYTAIVKNIKHEMIRNTLVPIPHSAYKKGFRSKTILNPCLEVISHGDQTMLDLQEIIDGLSNNDTEKCILKRLIMRGFSRQEIADEVSVSGSRVSQIKSALLQKLFEELFK